MSKVLSIDDVIEKTSLSRTTIWRRQHEGKFPKPIRLSSNRVGWKETDVNTWIDSRENVE